MLFKYCKRLTATRLNSQYNISKMIFFRFSITSISKVIKRVSQTYELQRISLENLQCAGHTSNG